MNVDIGICKGSIPQNDLLRADLILQLGGVDPKREIHGRSPIVYCAEGTGGFYRTSNGATIAYATASADHVSFAANVVRLNSPMVVIVVAKWSQEIEEAIDIKRRTGIHVLAIGSKRPGWNQLSKSKGQRVLIQRDDAGIHVDINEVKYEPDQSSNRSS